MASTTGLAQEGVALEVDANGSMTIRFGEGASLTGDPATIRRFVEESVLLTVAETTALSDLLYAAAATAASRPG